MQQGKRSMAGDTEQKTEATQHIIVVERRSLIAEIAGIWLLAIPVLAAFLFCLPRQDRLEIERKELNLPPTGWSKPSLSRNATKPELSAEFNPSESISNQNSNEKLPLKVNRIELTQDQKETAKEPMTTAPDNDQIKSAPTVVNNLPMGVVVLNNSVNQLNPVAVFDPKQQGAAENKTNTGNVITNGNKSGEKANLGPDTGAANGDTGAALAEIQKAAESARNAKQADEAIKPLLAIHDAEKARLKASELQEAMRQRAMRNQRPFLMNLSTILSAQNPNGERSAAIENLMEDDLKGVDARFFQNALSDLQSTKTSLSTAKRIRILRNSFVPESIILAYLADLEKKDGGKSRGSARNNADALIKAGRMLLTNSVDILK
jgi:hypothetical protein